MVTLVAFGFCFWMFYDCARHEPNKTFWCLFIFLLNLIGATAYFLFRWLPRSVPFLKGWANRKAQQSELQRAIADVRNIGKAHQFVKLGQLYQEMGEGGHALAAYQQALTREANNVEALWGSATIELKNAHPELSVTWLRQLMAIRPDYKFGDASLLYGRVLFELGDFNAAQQQLEHYWQRWSHPEAALLMAQIRAHQQNAPGACEVLETMIANVQGGPAFHACKHRKHVVQGQQMLKTFRRRSAQ